MGQERWDFFAGLLEKFAFIKLLPDFDGDGYIGASDIENAVKLLTQNELNHEEIESIWEKVIYFLMCIKTHPKISLYILGIKWRRHWRWSEIVPKRIWSCHIKKSGFYDNISFWNISKCLWLWLY